ncbi:MAG: B12-binding domain-containing radical SAM protein [Deltaproteobacteria bacterium]|nr:B12-binding domain-containing radical SAM protein [Deltaproteobacteria bacterium]
MKAVLIRPDSNGYVTAATPPLGLAYLHAGLKKAGVDVEVADLGHQDLTRKKLFERLAADPPDLVGVQAFTRSLFATKDVIDGIDTAIPKSVPIVVGGPHPSALPTETLDEIPRATYVLTGEADESLPALAAELAKGDRANPEAVTGLYWRENGQVRGTAQHLPQDLDSLGHIDWDYMKPLSYRAEELTGFTKYTPAAQVYTSRGCPYLCEYCSVHVVNGRKIRRHSAEFVLEDMERLHKGMGFPEIRIMDDNFPTQRKYVLDFCEKLAAKNWDLAVSMPCGVHLQLIDDELLDALKSIGVYGVAVAVEAGSDRILKAMKKGINIKLVKEKTKLITAKGLDATGYFILGYPTETREEIKTTIKLSRSLGLTRAHYNVFMPFPGTKITERLETSGQLETIPWEHHHFESVNFSYCEVSADELRRLRKMALYSFYLRPHILWHFLTKLSSARQFVFVLRKFLEYTQLSWPKLPWRRTAAASATAD